MDVVTCTSFKWNGLVEAEEEECPSCESEGTLWWTYPEYESLWEIVHII